MASSRRNLVVCAEDTDAAANACQWMMEHIYREGDRVHLVYVIKSLKPPLEIFHGPPGTSYSFDDPGRRGAGDEQRVIDAAKAAIEARYVPILTPKMVPYELHLYAERKDASADKVGELILKCAEARDTPLVVLASHNIKSRDTDRFMGEVGSVARYVIKYCSRPLAVVPPPPAHSG